MNGKVIHRELISDPASVYFSHNTFRLVAFYKREGMKVIRIHGFLDTLPHV